MPTNHEHKPQTFAKPANEMPAMDSYLPARYEIIEALEGGAQAHAYRAKDHEKNGEVFIKSIAWSELSDWKTHELYQREVEALQQLNHPHIAKYVDSFELDTARGKHLVLVQSYIAAPNLSQELGRQRPFNLEEFFSIAEQLFDILGYLQSLEPAVVHRDIKPSNLLLDDTGKLTLVDFGLVASPLKEGRGSTVAGTFGYMAPEQLMGQASPASDIYAAFVTLLHILTGVDPAKMDTLSFQLQFEPYLRDLPHKFLDFFRDALHAKPEQRLVDAAEITKKLESLKSDLSENQMQLAQAMKVQEQWASIMRERRHRSHNVIFDDAVQRALLEYHKMGKLEEPRGDAVMRYFRNKSGGGLAMLGAIIGIIGFSYFLVFFFALPLFAGFIFLGLTTLLWIIIIAIKKALRKWRP